MSEGVSRRDFLKGVGAAAVAGAALSQNAQAEEEQENRVVPDRKLGPGPVTVSLQINGKTRTLKLEPRVTLLDCLRNRLDLTGTKEVCDRGACGACTVHLDGKPVASCMTLAIDCEGKEIMTIEGVAPSPDELHPLQTAFIEHDALQCGFCTPGMILSAKALLDTTRNPTLQQIRHALSGNLCRCGTYAQVFEAVQSAAGRIGKGQ